MCKAYLDRRLFLRELDKVFYCNRLTTYAMRATASDMKMGTRHKTGGTGAMSQARSAKACESAEQRRERAEAYEAAGDPRGPRDPRGCARD